MTFHDPNSSADIENRFSYHPATTPERQDGHEKVRAACKVLAHYFDQHLPPGRHKSLALTAVEESMHWANAAIACQEPAKGDVWTFDRPLRPLRHPDDPRCGDCPIATGPCDRVCFK